MPDAMAQNSAAAQSGDDDFTLAATLETRLAYVITGNREIDDASHAGLWGLTEQLRRRTAVEGEQPIGINLEKDPILFFPLLYWPMIADQATLSDAALAKIDAFMKTGGTILFDTPGPGRAGRLCRAARHQAAAAIAETAGRAAR